MQLQQPHGDGLPAPAQLPGRVRRRPQAFGGREGHPWHRRSHRSFPGHRDPMEPEVRTPKSIAISLSTIVPSPSDRMGRKTKEGAVPDGRPHLHKAQGRSPHHADILLPLVRSRSSGGNESGHTGARGFGRAHDVQLHRAHHAQEDARLILRHIQRRRGRLVGRLGLGALDIRRGGDVLDHDIPSPGGTSILIGRAVGRYGLDVPLAPNPAPRGAVS